VVQAVLAFVAAADGLELSGGWEELKERGGRESEAAAEEGAAQMRPEGRWPAFRRQYGVIPTGILDQLAQVVGSAAQWPMAEELLLATGVGPVCRFRASCAMSGRTHKGFDCTDAMRAIGGGGLAAHAFGEGPSWVVDLKAFQVELYGFIFHGTFTCGLLLGGQWRRNTNKDKYHFSKAPAGERACRPYTIGDHQPWFMPRLRPSTAMLLLLLAELKPGETILDPMGGCGTIAIEAAVHFEGVCALSVDNNSIATSAAIKNCVLARPHLAVGSTVKAVDGDARSLLRVEDASVDRIITDMPFGNRCRWNVAEDLPKVLGEMERVLKPTGKVVLLTKGYRRVEALLTGMLAEDDMNGSDETDEEEGDDESMTRVDPSEARSGDASVPAVAPAATAELALPTPTVSLLKTGKGTIRQAKGGYVTLDKESQAVGAPATTGVREDGVTGARAPLESEVVEKVPGAAKLSGRPSFQFSILNRRQIAIGGYLCYALILEKTVSEIALQN